MLQQHIYSGFAWIIFCVLHSVLADAKVKQKIAVSFPGFFKYYRFAYTFFAFITLIAVLLYQVSIPSPMLYLPTRWMMYSGSFIAVTGAVIMLICIKKYFLSLSGIKSLFANNTLKNNLSVDGVHKFVRHPLYLGTFIFIWGGFIVFPYVSLLIAVTVITVYTLIGIRLEEQKLITEYGESYLTYTQQTPRIIPAFKRKNLNKKKFEKEIKRK